MNIHEVSTAHVTVLVNTESIAVPTYHISQTISKKKCRDAVSSQYNNKYVQDNMVYVWKNALWLFWIKFCKADKAIRE